MIPGTDHCRGKLLEVVWQDIFKIRVLLHLLSICQVTVEYTGMWTRKISHSKWVMEAKPKI